MHYIVRVNVFKIALTLLSCLKKVARKELSRCVRFKTLRPTYNIYLQVMGDRKQGFAGTFDNIMPLLPLHLWGMLLIPGATFFQCPNSVQVYDEVYHTQGPL